MKLWTMAASLGLGLLFGPPALADNWSGSCSTRAMAGPWLFATDVGDAAPGLLGEGVPGRAITALGTLNIDLAGGVAGFFDVTVEELVFNANVPFFGTITVDPDCTGTLMFETAAGTSRTDSIAVIGPGELRGMSQDPENIWTYRAWRIPGPRR